VTLRRKVLALVTAAISVSGLVAVFVIRPEQPTWSGRQLSGNFDVIWYWLLQHVRFTVVAMAAGTALALPLAFLAIRRPGTYPFLLSVTNVLYAVPSLALFIVLGTWIGFLSDTPVVVAMALYTLIILVRNIVEAVRSVPDPVVRAADGMGYRRTMRFFAVELPLAVPGIVAGLRLATVSTVSLISVGALLGRGGLGRLFNDARQRSITIETWSGVVAIVALALVLDALLVFAGWLVTPWQPRSGRRIRRAPAAVGAGPLAGEGG
jgi:osmoprotectant transport system permease protein